MIPTDVLRAGLAQMVTEHEARQVIAAQGGFARSDNGSRMLLNRVGCGMCDGWTYDYSGRGIGFGPYYMYALWIGAPRIIAAILTVAAVEGMEHAELLDRLVEMLTAPEEASGQLSLLDGAA